MIYIVMIGIPSCYSYDGLNWNIEKVFSTKTDAEKYILQQSHNEPGIEYTIQAEEVQNETT